MSDGKISIGYPSVGEPEADAVYQVVMSGLLTQGKVVAAAEAAFSEVTGIAHSIAVGNGTLALELALRAHGISAGDEVITTPFSFFATAASIVNSGATPVFVDIEPDTFNINPKAIEDAITPKTAAIMPVHLYGRMADMSAIQAIANRHDLVVIEDAAQAAGAWLGDKHAGSFGTGSFSFYGAKNITSGEGGMVTTNDSTIAERLRLLRNHGSKVQYVHEEVSSNYRMTDVHAAILRVQIAKLEKLTIRRQENAAFYDEGITSPAVLKPLPSSSNNRCCFHQYTLRVPGRRNELQAKLAERNIDARAFYPAPMHRQPALNMKDVHMPVAELASEEVLAIPVHPNLTSAQRERVAASINEITKGWAQ